MALRDYGGEQNARGIILVHGLASNVAIWDLVGPMLAESYRVVAFDQRGHGLSDDSDDLSFERLAADCAAVAATVRDPVLVGHSWGASVVLHCAATHGCAGVVCVDGGLYDFQSGGRSWEDTRAALTPPHIEGPANEVLERLRQFSQLPWDAAERVVKRTFVVGSDGIMRRRTPIPVHMKIVRHMWEDNLMDAYASIACPILLVPARGAERNAFTDAKQAAISNVLERNANVRVEWVESIHDVPLYKPNELASIVSEFAANL
jgi:pimeloyl-ACP methyl ester carboxylesterase